MSIGKKLGDLAVMATAIFAFGFSGGDAAAQGMKNFGGGERKPAARCYIEVTKNGKPVGIVLDLHRRDGGVIMPGNSGRRGYGGNTASDAAIKGTTDSTGIKIAAISDQPINDSKDWDTVKIFHCVPNVSPEYDILKQSFQGATFVADPDTGRTLEREIKDLSPQYEADIAIWQSLYPYSLPQRQPK